MKLGLRSKFFRLIKSPLSFLNIGFCKDRHTGTYPNTQDCHSYWLCVNGHTYPVTCPGNLVYNYKIYSCDDRTTLPLVV